MTQQHAFTTRTVVNSEKLDGLVEMIQIFQGIQENNPDMVKEKIYIACRSRYVSRVLFPLPVTRKGAMIIHLGQQLPAASSDTTRELRTGRPKMFSYLVLLRMGFTKLFRSPGKR